MAITTRKKRVWITAMTATCMVAPMAHAQISEPAEAGIAVDDIVVTAQRRTERLQDVPISATVIGSADLQKRNDSSLEALTGQTPAVVVTKGGPGNRLSIRGIGSGDNNPLFEQSVATFIDGIYQGRSRSISASFLDVARVEILKGPQSVYFGNNAIAGVLNLVSQNPGDELSGFARGAYNATFESATVEGAIGGPVTDTFGIRIAGAMTRGQGYITELSEGVRIPRVRSYAGRATFRWTPTDRIDWTVKISGEHSRQLGAIADEIAFCPPAPLFTAGATGNCLAAINRGEDVTLNQRRTNTAGQGIDTDVYGFSSTLNYDAGSLQLSSITGYSHTDYDQRLDTDGNGATLTHVTTPELYRQFSQEFRVATPRDNFLAFDAGAYFGRERLHGRFDFNYGVFSPRLTGAFAPLAPFGNYAGFDDYLQVAKTYATYLFLTVKPTSDITLSFGGRQSWVDKSLVLTQGFGYIPGAYGTTVALPTAPLQTLANTFGTAAGLGVVGVRRARRSDDHFAPSVVLSYEPNPNLHLYAKYTNGFKAGGFNGVEHSGNAAALAFDPEYVDGYELGAKTQWLNRRLTLNLALFRNDFDDLQVSASQNFGPAIVTVIRNAGGARAQGLELEGRMRVSPALTAGFSFTALDSKYTNFPNAAGSAVDAQQGRTFVDLTGKRTRYAPKYSGDVDLDLNQPITSGLKLHLNGNMFFTSSYNFSNNNDPFLAQGKYARLGAIVGIGDVDDRWEISVVGKNLTDRTIRVFGTNLPQSRGTYLIGTDEPLSITVQARINF